MVQELIKISYEDNIHNLDVVYFIQSGEFVKIGQTGCLVNRLSHFKTHNPHPMNVVGLIKGTAKEEKILHEIFKHLHVKNEWFKYEQEIQDIFSNFKPISLEQLHDRVTLQAALADPRHHAQTIRRLIKKLNT